MKKRQEFKRIRLFHDKRSYTKDELDAISYFEGTGYYKEAQNPKREPNIHDTRQTFLLQKHDPVRRIKFLDGLNSNSKNY